MQHHTIVVVNPYSRHHCHKSIIHIFFFPRIRRLLALAGFLTLFVIQRPSLIQTLPDSFCERKWVSDEVASETVLYQINELTAEGTVLDFHQIPYYNVLTEVSTLTRARQRY